MNWQPPNDWQRIHVIDAHTAGEPLRVITEGIPFIPGATMLEKRRLLSEKMDFLRTALMWEPRGHADMYGCIPTPPVTADGHIGVLFLHNQGYSTMCGHGIIGLVKVAVEFGLFGLDKVRGPIRIDTPAGRVVATAHRDGPGVGRVSFRNVPSFVSALGLGIDVDGLPRLECDIAFGGAFYVLVEAAAVGLDLKPSEFARLVELGRRIKDTVSLAFPVSHPSGNPDLNFLYGTIFVGTSPTGLHSRNVCVFADGEVDRSPTGTGVSARAAVHFARGELELGKKITIESLIGTSFDVAVVGLHNLGEDRPAVIPEVTGTAHITGISDFFLDPEDPLRHGFFLR